MPVRFARFVPPLLSRVMVVAVLLGCALPVGYLSIVLLAHQRTMARTSRYDVSWAASEALVQSLRLQLALLQLAQAGTDADPDRARLLFEIMQSGVRTLHESDASFAASVRPEQAATIADLTAAAAAVKRLMPSVEQPGVARQVLAVLEPFNARLAGVASLADASYAQELDEDQDQVARDERRLTALLLLLGGYAAMLVTLLARRNRLLTLAHADVRSLAESVHAADVELRRQNHHFHAAIDNMSQALCMIDGAERLIVCNPQFIAMFSLDPAECLPGAALADIVGGLPAGERRLIEEVRAEHLTLAQRNRPASSVREWSDGRWLSVSHQPLPAGGWVATYEDVTARRQAEARVAFLAHHDILTGLPNRVLYRRRIEEIVDTVGPHSGHLSVLLLDLDHFKEINDALGHGMGDALLEAVALRLRGCTRDADMVARLGGDEFAVVQAPGIQPHDAASLARRIVDTIGKPYLIGGERVQISASVGIAVEPALGASAEVLLKYADMALYQAKADGRDTFCFYQPQMDAQLQARRAIASDLRDAIALGQFEVHYQPLIDLLTGDISAFEALIRWRHPTRGLVPPVHFIPLAEESGLITAIGDWVLRTACAEATRWPDHVRVAVNLSPRQFRSGDVSNSVMAALAQSGLAPSRLELEITESLLLQDGDDVLDTLRGLRARGIGVALDDFGTGYSSLSYLRKFPFSKLKIDQSFVRGMDGREDCVIIIQAVAAMARRLGMTVTAEGIESEEQLAIIREAGCTQGQGYLFGRPAPASEALRLLAPREPALMAASAGR